MTRFRSTAAWLGLAVTLAAPVPAASAQTAPATATPVAPRTPGGVSAGAVNGSQHKMDATVGSIDDTLLNEEKDRPRLPGQAPSPSQTPPGGTAASTPPHR